MSTNENEIKIHHNLMQAPVRVKGESLQRNIEDQNIYIPQILANLASTYNSSVAKNPEGRTAELGANNWRLRIATIGELPLALVDLPIEKRGRLDVTEAYGNIWCLTYFGPISSKNIIAVKFEPKRITQSLYTAEVIIARPDIQFPNIIFYKIKNVQNIEEISELFGDFVFGASENLSTASTKEISPIKKAIISEFAKYF